MKALLIYIPTYNRLPKLKFCLTRLLEEIQGVEDSVEIHVSDNCSPDGTLEYLEELKNPCLSFSRNTENIGLPRNMLKSHDLAHVAEFTWIIGDDDVVLGGSVKRLLQEIEYHRNVDLFFLNTACFAECDRDRVLTKLADTNFVPMNIELPSRSSVMGNFNCSHRDLIDPRVDNLLGGSVMCYAWRSQAVQNHLEPNEVSLDFSQPKACYHVAVNYLYAIGPDSLCRHIGDCLTANFWHGGTDWGSGGYTLAVTQGLGILLYEATRLGFISDGEWKTFFLHYLKMSKTEYRRLLDRPDEYFMCQLSFFHPYLSQMLLRYLLDVPIDSTSRGGKGGSGVRMYLTRILEAITRRLEQLIKTLR